MDCAPCPGTGLAGSGEGSRDAMVGVLGMITGAGVFVACYNWLEPIMLSLGDYGKITIPLLLDVPPWLVIGSLVVFGARFAGGCTSGHGISGTLQLAVQSWTFIVLAFTVAIATAFLVFGKEGRNHV